MQVGQHGHIHRNMVTKGEYERRVREAKEIATSDPEQFKTDFNTLGTGVYKPVGPCKHLITFNQGERIRNVVKVITICFECRAAL